MKKILLSISIFIAISSFTQAQEITEQELTGTWKVLKVEAASAEISSEEKTQLDLMKNLFLKSKFIFLEDKNFSFDIDIKDLQMKNVHWKLFRGINTILVQEWKDKEKEKPLLMGITVKKEGEKTFFFIYETPIKLQVQKED